MNASFRLRADLALRVLDGVTGMPPAPDRLRFLFGERPLAPLRKGELWVFCGLSAPCEIAVQARGYQPFPMLFAGQKNGRPTENTILLVPAGDYRCSLPCRMLSGTLAGLSAIELAAEISGCRFRAFDADTRVLTLQNSHRAPLDLVRYALVGADAPQYEPFEIIERLSDTEFRTDRVLQGVYRQGDPLARRISGAVFAEGRYLAFAREEIRRGFCAARFTQNGREYFQPLDFSAQEPPLLKGGR